MTTFVDPTVKEFNSLTLHYWQTNRTFSFWSNCLGPGQTCVAKEMGVGEVSNRMAARRDSMVELERWECIPICDKLLEIYNQHPTKVPCLSRLLQLLLFHTGPYPNLVQPLTSGLEPFADIGDPCPSIL